MSFQLTGISENHFQQISEFFEKGLETDKLLEHSQKISHPLVEGQSNEWYFNGIRMGYSDWHYQKPVDLQWKYDIKVDMVTLQVNLKGSVFIGSDDKSSHRLFDNYQHNLFYANANNSNEGILKSDSLKASLFFIQFTKDAFLRLTKDANDALNRFSDDVLNARPSLLSNANLPVNTTITNLIKSILHCNYKDNLKKMFLLSKCIEFLVIQAEACNATITPSYRYLKSKHDEECMIHAREYVMSHLDSPPGLTELAKIIGTNEYKLKRGFKEMYGNTVFGYIADARLEIAKNDLLEKRKSVAEIALELGYSSPQHFSSAFRKKYGSAPSKLKT